PAFHVSRFPNYAVAIVAAAQRLADRWQTEQPERIEISEAMTGLTQTIIAKTLFDVDLTEETKRLGQAVVELSEAALREAGRPFTLPDWLPLPSIRRKRNAMRYLDETIRRFIRERRASRQDRGDLLSMLLQAVDEEGDGRGLSDEQARSQVTTLFLAG